MIIENPTENDLIFALNKLDGTTCSEIHLIFNNKHYLYIVGDGDSKRVRVEYTGDSQLLYLSDKNNLNGNMWVILSNGENDEIPYTETIGIDDCERVAQYFLSTNGMLHADFREE